MTRRLLAALLLCACGQQASNSPIEAQRCEAVFTPEGDIVELVEGAARQWSEATGCDVRAGDGGIPVAFVDRIVDAHGNPQCAETHRVRDEAGAILGADFIHVSLNAADRCRLHARDVLHEMGHGLAPHRGHTTEGLMARVPNGVDVVDDVSRAFICGELGC